MTIDERIEAVTMSLELLTRDVQDLKILVRQDAENIRALAGVAQDLDGVTRRDADSIHTLAEISQKTHDSIKRLENVVVAHDERLDDLESR